VLFDERVFWPLLLHTYQQTKTRQNQQQNIIETINCIHYAFILLVGSIFIIMGHIFLLPRVCELTVIYTTRATNQQHNKKIKKQNKKNTKYQNSNKQFNRKKTYWILCIHILKKSYNIHIYKQDIQVNRTESFVCVYTAQ
jgi:hypothetical protein